MDINNLTDDIDEEYIPKHASKNNYVDDNKEKKRAEINLNDQYIDIEKTIFLSKSELNKTQDIDIDTKETNEINIFDNESNENNRTRKKKEKIIKLIIILIVLFILIGAIIYSLFKISNWIIDNKKNNNIVKKIEEISEIEEVSDDDNTEIINEEDDKDNPYWYYITFPLINVDITKLKEENSDTVGWININSTNVNYPFVQTSDNDYYLTHSFDKNYNEAGWLFLDYRNNSDFNNRNNIIYGHSRLDKTMFGSLSKVLKNEWQTNKDNHVIRISLENENTLWQIFSVYKIKTEAYYITTDFINDDDYLEFLNTIKKRSLYDFNTNLSSSDKILTLSTCYSDIERTVVHARLIKRAPK